MENYSEYVDYNSTTTQSDRGEMLYTLLDFLHVEASYDRMAWNLKPVVMVHDVLVHCGRRGGGRPVAADRAPADAVGGQRASQAVRPVGEELRDAAAEHLPTAGRAVRPSAGHQSALCPGPPGGGGASRA